MLTFVSIYGLASYVFASLITIQALIEGGVILFLVQEIPCMMFEMACYISEEVEEHLKFELRFKVPYKVKTSERVINLVVSLFVVIFANVMKHKQHGD